MNSVSMENTCFDTFMYSKLSVDEGSLPGTRGLWALVGACCRAVVVSGWGKKINQYYHWDCARKYQCLQEESLLTFLLRLVLVEPRGEDYRFSNTMHNVAFAGRADITEGHWVSKHEDKSVSSLKSNAAVEGAVSNTLTYSSKFQHEKTKQKTLTINWIRLLVYI